MNQITLTRADLVLLHTLCGSRRVTMQDSGVLVGEDVLAQSNRAYDHDLMVLQHKLDLMVSEADAAVEVIDCPPTPEGYGVIRRALDEAQEIPPNRFSADPDEGFTVFTRQFDGTGTTHVTFVKTTDITLAKNMAKVECSQDWGDYGTYNLSVIGVAEGNVQILEWNDGE